LKTNGQCDRSHLPNYRLAIAIGNRQFGILCLVSLSLFLFIQGAEPSSDAGDLFRQGNAAFSQEDYESALRMYCQAEGKFADPGWLAFNEGAALYRLGRYREAEMHYWLSRQDASGSRLARVLYDLGNAILRQAANSDAALIHRAIGLYLECLSQSEAGPDLLEDARHNLALARELLKKAKGGKESAPEDSNQSNKPANISKPLTQPNSEGSDSGTNDESSSGQKTSESSESENRSNSKNTKSRPGIGNLPPVPDSDQLVPLNPEDTSAYLQKAEERSLRERRLHYGKSSARPSRNVKDW